MPNQFAFEVQEVVVILNFRHNNSQVQFRQWRQLFCFCREILFDLTYCHQNALFRVGESPLLHRYFYKCLLFQYTFWSFPHYLHLQCSPLPPLLYS